MSITLDEFKKHLQFEDGMDESMLGFYLDMGKKYAQRATDHENSPVAYYIASIFWLYKVPEQEMTNALNALTPLILSEGLVDDDVSHAQSNEMES
ncbi:phage gp6-like head-tail connector protein [Melissococcus plutonius]|nr:phage gp6-like head-tail connector protein [Melissococcus plutonius]MCV2499600.1 phage gp6-like head-tail connector protein [Melissococcus plutonius]MCV2501520.1 phage gp6-like head-tail connector protein [Melissococcus plutonius]MCV2505979.1 phage gp6-like head-tail connector protein [Melissococcus plutonius]MCV2508220.1 phage gp6-like head-tail connector protein [Melissococcus plutonius]MCV2519992.1 phage gp6-like head-tail connector protein [Melissococcus plutonius]